MKRRIKNALILLLSSVIIGTLLLIVTFCLPVKSARSNVNESRYEMMDVVYDENGSSLRKQIISRKDNFTDYLMVQNALERVEGQNALEHAMYVYHYDIGNDTTWLTEESLSTFLKQGTEGMFLKEYSKYWHGYLVWLKPLLMCMSWKSVETFLVIFQVLLLLGVVVLSFYKKRPLAGIGVLVAFLFMKPLSVWFSLTLSTCWTITLFALMAELLFYHKIEKKNWRDELFLLIGILTAYMDFLTYPIVTLGVPLCVYLIQNVESDMHWWKRIRQFFWLCVCWAGGYIGMWGMKWVVAEITCQSGTLRNAVWSVIYRTGPLDGYGSAFSGVSRTLQAVLDQYDSDFYTIAFVIVAVTALISMVLCFIKARNRNWGTSMVCMAFVAMFPFVWLTLTQNHTAIHCEFTFRIMGVTIMALCSMAICSIHTIRRKARENGK